MTASILDAATSMLTFDERVLIVADREITISVAHGGDPQRHSLQEIMRAGIGFVTEADNLFDTVHWMHQNHLREVVVHGDNGSLVGIVTVDQLCCAIAGEVSAEMVCAPEGMSCGDRPRFH